MGLFIALAKGGTTHFIFPQKWTLGCAAWDKRGFTRADTA